MGCSLSNKCAKNFCKRTVLLQLIIKNVVTCFFLEHSVHCPVMRIMVTSQCAALKWWLINSWSACYTVCHNFCLTWNFPSVLWHWCLGIRKAIVLQQLPNICLSRTMGNPPTACGWHCFKQNTSVCRETKLQHGKCVVVLSGCWAEEKWQLLLLRRLKIWSQSIMSSCAVMLDIQSCLLTFCRHLELCRVLSSRNYSCWCYTCRYSLR